MTIQEIKRRYVAANPNGHFFDDDTMKAVGQTLDSFTVTQEGERWLLTAPRFSEGEPAGTTRWYFNPASDNMEPFRETSAT